MAMRSGIAQSQLGSSLYAKSAILTQEARKIFQKALRDGIIYAAEELNTPNQHVIEIFVNILNQNEVHASPREIVTCTVCNKKTIWVKLRPPGTIALFQMEYNKNYHICNDCR